MFRESWTAKKARIRAGSPYGHLANWDVCQSRGFDTSSETDLKLLVRIGDCQDRRGPSTRAIGRSADSVI